MLNIIIFAPDYGWIAEGTESPLFYYLMDQKVLHSAIEEALANNEAYLVDLIVEEGNKITLFVDADNGINVQQLKMINREVEGVFDRDVEDFDLTVSSPGLERPFKVRRQYVNNVGRWVKVKLNEGEKVIGELINVTEENITLNIPGEKKKDPNTEKTFAFDEIIETKIEIRF